MDKLEAIEVLEKEPITKEATSNNGKKYYIENITHRDDKPDGNIRVHGCVDVWRLARILSIK